MVWKPRRNVFLFHSIPSGLHRIVDSNIQYTTIATSATTIINSITTIPNHDKKKQAWTSQKHSVQLPAKPHSLCHSILFAPTWLDRLTATRLHPFERPKNFTQRIFFMFFSFSFFITIRSPSFLPLSWSFSSSSFPAVPLLFFQFDANVLKAFNCLSSIAVCWLLSCGTLYQALNLNSNSNEEAKAEEDEEAVKKWWRVSGYTNGSEKAVVSYSSYDKCTMDEFRLQYQQH